MRLVLCLPFVDPRRLSLPDSDFLLSDCPDAWRPEVSFIRGVGRVTARNEGTPWSIPGEHLVFDISHHLRFFTLGPGDGARKNGGASREQVLPRWRYLSLRRALGWVEIGWEIQPARGQEHRPVRSVVSDVLRTSMTVGGSPPMSISAAGQAFLAAYAEHSRRKGPSLDAAPPIQMLQPAVFSICTRDPEPLVTRRTSRAYGLRVTQELVPVEGKKLLLTGILAEPDEQTVAGTSVMLRVHVEEEVLRYAKRAERMGTAASIPLGSAESLVASRLGFLRRIAADDRHAETVADWLSAWADLRPDGFAAEAGRPIRGGSPRAVRLFVSYSRHDQDARDTLARHLVPTQRLGLAHVWHDGRLDVGRRFDRQIREELARADIVVFLLSEHLLSTAYVNEVEIPAAVARADRGQAVVFPIILSPCLWTETPLSEFSILPSKATPIRRFPDPAVAWVAVAERLSREIERISRNTTSGQRPVLGGRGPVPS